MSTSVLKITQFIKRQTNEPRSQRSFKNLITSRVGLSLLKMLYLRKISTPNLY